MSVEPPRERQRWALLEFLSGLFAGIGIILLTLLVAIVVTSSYRGPAQTKMAALVWLLLVGGLSMLVYRHRGREHRRSSFTAGLVTAAALFLLLLSACWNSSLT